MSILVLISGSGSNLQALIDAGLPVKHVISSSAEAYGLERAAKAGIPTTVQSLEGYYAGVEGAAERRAARGRFNRDLAKLVLGLKPSLVVCAGWMLILAPAFLNPLGEAKIGIINLHPALPGAFPGIHAIERAWQAGQDGTAEFGGVMIHYVIAAVDEGEPIVVKRIPLVKQESVEEYEARVHSVEHAAIVEGTRIALRAASERAEPSEPSASEASEPSVANEAPASEPSEAPASESSATEPNESPASEPPASEPPASEHTPRPRSTPHELATELSKLKTS